MKATRPAGFSLLELLAVIGLIAVAAGLFGGTTWHVLSAMQLRSQAGELVQTLQNARRYAIDHACRTRVTFRRGLYAPEDDASGQERSYQLHAFIVPTAATGAQARWVPLVWPAREKKQTLPAEWVRRAAAPRSPGLVGRWLVCDLQPKAKQLDAGLLLTSPLFQRFKTEARAEFFAANFFQPENVWGETSTDPHAAANCFAAFPEDYVRTPVDLGPVLLTGPLPEDEKCLDPQTGDSVQAAQFWPGTVSFIRGHGKSQSEELPGVEFAPDGSLVCTWTREVTFRLAQIDRPHPSYSIVIDTATGRARLLEEAAP
jgi:prepilin-type N-terminal cleavage/methylation domain-containing protein